LVWFYELYHRTKSFMKSLILKVGFFLTGKLLKNRLVLAFIALNSVQYGSSRRRFYAPFQPKRLEGFRIPWSLVDEEDWLVCACFKHFLGRLLHASCSSAMKPIRREAHVYPRLWQPKQCATRRQP